MRVLVAITALSAAATLAATVQAAASPTQCGAVSGPAVHVAGVIVNHYAIYRIGTNCAFTRRTVSAILEHHLPNSRIPVRVTGPAGWICVAQEVDNHIPVAGHCQRNRSSAFAWTGVGLHR
jgi:hypothetical protein